MGGWTGRGSPGIFTHEALAGGELCFGLLLSCPCAGGEG